MRWGLANGRARKGGKFEPQDVLGQIADHVADGVACERDGASAGAAHDVLGVVVPEDAA